MEAEGGAQEQPTSPESQNLSQSMFSLNRVKAIIKEDVEVKSISTEACFVVAKATEHFLEAIASKGGEKMLENNKMSLEYNDIANTVADWKAMDFLHEIVPKKIQAAVALARMEPKEQQPKQQQAQPSAT